MTRETKVGLIVAASFLCLVGIVVASKMGRGGAPGARFGDGRRPTTRSFPGSAGRDWQSSLKGSTSHSRKSR